MITNQSSLKKDNQKNEISQLQEDPLKLQLESQAENNSYDLTKDKILQLVNKCLQEIGEMIKQVDTNPKLGKYFEIASTNRAEILQGLNEMDKNIKIMKDRVDEPTTNLKLQEVIFTFLNEITKKNEMKKMKNIEKAIWILQFQSKVSNSMELIINSVDLPLDITTKDKKYYKDVWERIHFSVLGNDKDVQKDLQFTKKMLIITTSACLNEEKQNFAVSKLFSFGLSYPKYFLADKKGQLKSMIFYRKPTVNMASKIWNLPQNGMIMELSKVTLKSIENNIKIYIPINQQKENTDIFVDDGQSIQVRLLYNQDLYIKNQKKKSFLICGVEDVQPDNFIDTVILHMHGGGFLALSSRSMQIYTRRWARDLRIPVFSVDYRMPPTHPFPTAPMDCLKVYKFLLTKIHKYMNIKPEKIIVAGDSAGGNLAFSLTGLIMRQKLPLPHAIYSAYPACDLRQFFSPSKLFAFTDPLLNPTMLLLCLKEYLQGKLQNENNPIASPLLLTQQFVGGQKGDKRFPLKWPRTIIHVGAKDPLYDDSLKIMERMTQSKINCECFVYENISHGFLNLEFAVPDCNQSIKDSIAYLKKLIH